MRGCRLLDCQPDFSYFGRDDGGNKRPLIILQKIQAAIIVSMVSKDRVREELGES